MGNHEYISPQKLVESGNYPFSMGQLRHYFLALRHKNGLKNAVSKVGKRLVIRVDLFEQWIEKQTNKDNTLN